MQYLLHLLFCITVTVAAADGSPSDPSDPHIIAVTPAASDLLAQPAIELDGGVRIRLGIEATTCAAGNTVLLYCLAEGYTGRHEYFDTNHLGPVRVVLAIDDQQALVEELCARSLQSEAQPGLPLYAFPISMPASGRCTVTVQVASLEREDCLTRPGRALAVTTIAFTPSSTGPWCSLGISKKQSVLREINDTEPPQTVFHDAGFIGTCPAVPSCDGMDVIAWLLPTEPEQLQRRLPTLSPSEPDPRFRLSWSGTQLVIDSDLPINFFGSDLPFLLRWWVNDRIVTPPLCAEEVCRNGGCSITMHRMVLSIDIDHEFLGAKSGDRIGVQCLYGPWRWKAAAQTHREQLAALQITTHDRPGAMLSNRVTFILP